jgi:hypothetical protein
MVFLCWYNRSRKARAIADKQKLLIDFELTSTAAVKVCIGPVVFVFRPSKWLIPSFFPFGVEWNRIRYYWGHCLAYCTIPDNDEWWRVWSNRWNACQGKPEYSEKTCPSAALFTADPTWPDLGSNPGRRGGKPATNRQSYGTAFGFWSRVLIGAKCRILWYAVRFQLLR